jgi:hypothetical protein
MAESSRFNPPFGGAVWIWTACAAAVAIALTYWATSAGERRQITATNIPTVSEPLLLPPITQPPPQPATPAAPDGL